MEFARKYWESPRRENIVNAYFVLKGDIIYYKIGRELGVLQAEEDDTRTCINLNDLIRTEYVDCSYCNKEFYKRYKNGIECIREKDNKVIENMENCIDGGSFTEKIDIYCKVIDNNYALTVVGKGRKTVVDTEENLKTESTMYRYILDRQLKNIQQPTIVTIHTGDKIPISLLDKTNKIIRVVEDYTYDDFLTETINSYAIMGINGLY